MFDKHRQIAEEFSMESRCPVETMGMPLFECSIDVYQTAGNNGFQVQPLKEKGERLNLFRLMSVD